MNKRARLARRILREHRRQPHIPMHISREFSRSALKVSDFWTCPRCGLRKSRLIPMEAPRAYR